ncbi:MAG: V-type ATPase subunit [Candidatus Micrarchaeia archaeon]
MRAAYYGYANTRVKAMEARLLDASTIDRIKGARSLEEVIPLLYNTDYKQNLAEFGGLSVKSNLLDFAISKNLAESVEKLARITPYKERKLMRMLLFKWGLSNAKLAVEAKYRGMDYSEIANYVIDAGPFGSAALKEAMEKRDVRSLLEFLGMKAPTAYKAVFEAAINAFDKQGTGFAAINAIDVNGYALMAKVALLLNSVDKNASRMVKLAIDVQNAITLLRAKAKNADAAEAEQLLIPNGSMREAELASAYAKAKSAEELAGYFENRGVAKGIAAYAKSGSLTSIEVSMRKQVLEKSRGMLVHVLSFAAILAYAYVKELEVMNLRTLVKSKQYGLSESEIAELVVA